MPRFNVAYLLRVDLPRRAAAGRPGPAGSRHRAAREGAAGAAGQVGVRAGDRLRPLLVAAGLRRGGRLVLARRGDSRTRRSGWRRWPRSTLARGRQPRVLAAAVAGDRPDGGRRVVPQRGAAAAAAARCDGSDRPASRSRRSVPASGRADRRQTGPISAGRLPAAARRSIPPGRRIGSSAGVVSLDRGRVCGPLPTEPSPAHDDVAARRPGVRARRPDRRQLSQRLHLPHCRGASRSSGPRRTAPRATDRSHGSKTCRLSAGSCCAAAAGPAARRISTMYPVVELATAHRVCGRRRRVRPEPAAGRAAGLCVRADRALCHRPASITSCRM